MGFFDSLWGWADYEPKDWSEAAYKRAYASSAGMAEFFALFWGWADYTRKDWSGAPNNSEHSVRRASSVRYRSS
jgi:hypothetical protein